MKPEHRDTRLGLHGVGNLSGKLGAQAQCRRCQAAVLEKTAAGDSLPAHHTVLGLGHRSTPRGNPEAVDPALTVATPCLPASCCGCAYLLAGERCYAEAVPL